MTPIAMGAKPKRRRPEVFANDCPHCASSNTRVTHTLKIVRYCLCVVCKKRWRQTPKG